VPLPECAGRVTGGFERLRNRVFVEVHPFARFGGSGTAGPDAAARMISSREYFGASRRADRANEKAFEDGAGGSQGIDIWRRDIDVAIETHISPALIVGQDEDDVGAMPGGSSEHRAYIQTERECELQPSARRTVPRKRKEASALFHICVMLMDL
jgi:hypothetical protein